MSSAAGVEETREELRKQVYDAMAEEEKTEVAASKLKSEDQNDTAEGKKENGATSPDINVAESQKPPESPMNVEKENGDMTATKPEEAKDKESISETVQDEEEPESSKY